MGLPAILETAQKYLFEDRDKMIAAGVPAVTADHIIRLRDSYDYWLANPSLRDKDIIERLKAYGGINKTQAYIDLRIVKQLLGVLQRTSKDYHMYRFLEMVQAAYDKAAKDGDTRSMVAAASQYAKYTKLDKDDDDSHIETPIQPFEVTDDPTVAGFVPIPNIREKIKKKKEQYWSEDVQYVDFEDIEFNEDEIFNPKKK